ncbi:hypothetical protein NE172_13885 [Clostridium botulinum]|uniref:Uncharacterized protein n=1 Tax=Clostridium botulinum TaxID=1491 RepID=A0A6B4JL91_CLOBO|nr:hypothetical protein [Clostridium botulinum]EES48178.1 conserved hypothetical protein [Clostridium botulinum E1 str. 'BoNT E Beluga']MBY6761125.1 hypothetical protein [Clostridium botulinum]MBY6921397.1 hypothetical protein [Clostridium botulinum]MCR1132029.1 hypothetical protein [Clostridium botulinum]NFE95154.1 hypothetical protein [Clostridium botulinum]
MIIKADKEKVLKEFKEKYVRTRSLNEFKRIITVYSVNKDNVKENLISEFNSICEKAILLQENKLKGEIKYIYLSMMRTKILKNIGQWRVDLYDEKWFLDKEECAGYMYFDFVYEELFNNMELLLEKKKEYGRVIKESDIYAIKQSEAEKYQSLVVKILKDILPSFLECRSFKEMKKNKDFVIAAGQYMDIAVKIYPEGL